ncbi:hypothetical protein DPMN_090937 [Dreissena polymorpha]|uniref:Uncharacterized protein n=1 Tax=Dreissena polymorpha TaxID=45954 RepID=A0A9D4KZ35_DREPO|nr:hypothetical protein DPMN_090937 [Dreissena polymorpha]
MVASRQVAQAMLEEFDPLSKSGNVLHQDATTKFHDHYEGAQVILKNVLSVKQVNKDTIKTEYNVQYEEDKDSIWFFPLLIDLKKGDLMII